MTTITKSPYPLLIPAGTATNMRTLNYARMDHCFSGGFVNGIKIISYMRYRLTQSKPNNDVKGENMAQMIKLTLQQIQWTAKV